MNGQRIRDMLAGAVGMLILIGLVTLIVLPQYSDYRERARVSGLLSGLSGLKNDVAEMSLSAGSLTGVGPLVSVGAYPHLAREADFTRVLENGEILVRTNGEGSFFMLQPVIEQDTVNWKCFGGPKRDMPSKCRFP